MKTEKTRHIPAGYVPVTAPIDSNAQVYVTDKCALGFVGNATKATFHYLFRNNEQRDKHVTDFYAGQVARWAEKKRHQRERAEFAHTLQVGDILTYSWGYEQTNVDFFQVVRVPSSKSVVIREIASKQTDDGIDSMTGKVLPVKDAFLKTGELLKRVKPGNTVTIKSYAADAYPWDGKPKRVSWYG